MKVTNITPKPLPPPPPLILSIELSAEELERLESERWKISMKFFGETGRDVPAVWELLSQLGRVPRK